MAPLSIWIITNGRRGDIVQCRAIAEKLIDKKSGTIIEKEMHPRTLWRFSAPFSFLDPKDRKKLPPPYPDLIIASGRRSVPAVRYLYKKTQGQCKAIFMKYPGVKTDKFGLSWIPTHDRRSGPAIINTLTTPHLVKYEDLKNTINSDFCKDLQSPALGIFLGGNSHHVTYTDKEIANFLKPLQKDLPFSSCLVTGSRRTPEKFLVEIEKMLSERPHFIWNGEGKNPYFDILAHSDAFYVTGDSHNMVSEVLAMGKKTYVYNPKGNPAKFNFTFNELEKKNLINLKLDKMEAGSQMPLNATDDIVAFIRKKLSL